MTAPFNPLGAEGALLDWDVLRRGQLVGKIPEKHRGLGHLTNHRLATDTASGWREVNLSTAEHQKAPTKKGERGDVSYC